MSIRQCDRCSKIYNFMGKPICPACVQEMDNIFIRVRDFLFDNRSASMDEVCRETGAEEEDVVRWLREGRLITGGDGQKLLTCESCGRPVAAGRYCETCNKEMISRLENTARQLQGDRPAQRPVQNENRNPRDFRGRTGGNRHI